MVDDAKLSRLPFKAGTARIGWVLPGFAELLLTRGCVESRGAICLEDARGLPDLASAASAAGAFACRGEAFDVREAPDGDIIGQIDRGALPVFGILAEGVHVNGLVARPDGLHLWVARRSAGKALDPGKLDHLVAGGISAGMTPAQTLLKEADEEASLPASLAGEAIHRGTLSYVLERPEGLRRDRLHCYDLILPDGFVPRARDGEVESFALWPLQRVRDSLAGADDFKFNVKLVLADLFRRLDQASTEDSRLG